MISVTVPPIAGSCARPPTNSSGQWTTAASQKEPGAAPDANAWAEIFSHCTERNRWLPHWDIGRKTARGRFFVGEPVAIRRPAQVPLDQTGLPLTLAGELRTAFADVVSTPLPRHLVALMRRLSADRDECSGKELKHGASATETSSRIDRRGRR